MPAFSFKLSACIGGVMRFILLPLLLLALGHAQCAEDVPNWILVGILKTESSSSYTADGSIKYVDRRRGKNGERGAFQMTKIAFDQVKFSGEQFWMIEQDPFFAELVARRYLLWLYEHSANRDWHRAVQQYNAGPNGKSPKYLMKVLEQ